MGLLSKISRSNFFIKLRNWEYWPFGIIQLPILIYWLWLSLRERSFTFFSASNPGIVMGGMFGESKFEVLKKIPPQHVPHTVLIELPATVEEVLQILKNEKFVFPVIFKPDIGERGFMVKRIHSENDISAYLKKINVRFLVQQLVDLPFEFGVYYRRFPSQPKGQVTSVVIKEFLFVTGDGSSTLRELIFSKDRAKLQWSKLKETYAGKLDEVIPRNKKIELVPIGNHAVGTKFIDGTHLINERLSSTFDAISKQIEEFYFGRFDLRCASVEDLYNGNIKIVELNGCGAEPAHIYDPDFRLGQALIVMFRHWQNIYQIAKENRMRGVNYPTLSEGWKYYQKLKAATRS